MRIALVVDNPFRDLAGQVLLATELCQRGATCYLVPLNLASLELSALAPDFVLLTSLRKPRQRFAAQLLDAGMKLGVLDSEGGVITSLEMYAKLTTPDFSLYRDISCFCSWGPKIADFVKLENWYNENQVFVTGSPRFDFYSERWQPAALQASSELDQFAKPIVLINGSFPRANPGVLTPAKELESWMNLGFDYEYVRRHQQTEQQTLLGMAKLANELAERFSEVTFVFRPHPFEKIDTYKEILKRRNNLHLIRSGTVEGWILRSSAVVHHHCTTGIEAGMARKPCLLPEWLPTAQRIESTERVSIKSSSQTELEEQLADVLQGNQHLLEQLRQPVNEVLNEWFFSIDGCAHKRAADAVLRQLQSGPGAVNLNVCRKIHYDWGTPGRNVRAKIGSAIRMGLNVPVSWSNTKFRDVKEFNQKWDHSVKHFDSGKVSHLLKSLGMFARPVAVKPAQEKNDYRLNYTVGRSLVLQMID